MEDIYFYQLLTKETCGGYEGYGPLRRYFSMQTYGKETYYFSTKEEMFDYFKQNSGALIPEIRVVKYIGNYEGLTDVVKITGLSTTRRTMQKDEISLATNKTIYCTALDGGTLAIYDENMAPYSDLNLKWRVKDYVQHYDSLESIYDEFEKRGIILNNNVYKTKTERVNVALLFKAYREEEEKRKKERAEKLMSDPKRRLKINGRYNYNYFESEEEEEYWKNVMEEVSKSKS